MRFDAGPHHGHTPPSIGRVLNCAGSITQCRTRWRFQV